MKKFFVVLLLLLFLCGCSKSKQIEPVLNNITFTAQIQYGDENFVCDTALSDNTLKLAVVEPNEIEGLTLTVDKEVIQAEFNGISFNPDIDSIPQGAIIKTLFSVLSDVRGKKIECVDKNCEVSGNTDGYKYNFVFSPNGLPISLLIDNIDLKINFSNVVLK